MARPREFDTDHALESAMQLFWSKGFEATSLDDLCSVTGLSRSSLYAAFGSKKKLLLQTVKRYSEQRTPNIEAVLAQHVPIRAAFASLASRFIDDIVAGPGRRGCYLGNCAAELPRHERATLAKVREGLAGTEAVFRAALAEARSRGELDRNADVQALARYLTAAFQGLRLVGKVNPDRNALNDIANTMLKCLDDTQTAAAVRRKSTQGKKS